MAEIGLGAEALAYLRSRVPLPEDAFRRLADELKSRAFTVAGVAKLDILQGILDEIARAIKDGTTFSDFKSAMQDFAKAKGWKGLSAYRLDNVFRTNVQTAYNVGRYRQMTDPAVLGSRPYWQYDAVMDRRTRPTHAALDGRVWRADDPFWDTWYPPNGYRCRCGVRTLSESQVRRAGIKVESGIPAMVEPPGQPARPLLPDPGFRTNPAKHPWEPDPSAYDPALAKFLKK